MTIHSRVAVGSLVLLTHPYSDESRAIAPECIAHSPAQAQARLRSGATTVVNAAPAQLRSLVDYAIARHRPVVIAGPLEVAQAYQYQLGRPARLVERANLTLLSHDLSLVTDPVVAFGDLHQCWRTYEALKAEARARYGENVLLVSTGDLFDKGGKGPEDVLATAEVLMNDVANGDLVAVAGNHDHVLAQRLAKALRSSADELSGVHRTPRALLSRGPAFATKVSAWLSELPLFVRLPFDTVAVHAAWNPELAAKAPNSKRFTENCLYGPRPPKNEPRFDANGKYAWVDWAPDYQGDETVVHGHHSASEVRVTGKVIALDTGCVEGNRLSAFLIGSDPADHSGFLSLEVHPDDVAPLPAKKALATS